MDPNAESRLPISHPYPPSYRSNLSPSPSIASPQRQQQHPHQTYPNPPSSFARPQYDNPAPYQPHGLRAPYDAYSNPNPFDRSPALSDSSQLPERDTQPLYPSASIPLTRHRSSSSSSQHPVLPKSGRNPQGGLLSRSGDSGTISAGKEGNDEYPPGWSKEDEEAEREFLKRGMFDWHSMKSWRFWIRKEWWYWYIAFIVLAVLVALMSLYHDEIVTWLKPAANWMKNLPAGWTIPIAVLFILSFPPLFGHEIVAVLCGVVWGLWVGFGIVAAGTFIGEIGNFYAFKYCLRSRAEKYERENLNYAIMAHVVRDGGFFFIFAVRLSAIPGHFSTAVFSTCGMNIFIFSIATILTLPKQLVVVYLGVLFNEQEKSSKSRIISWTVLVIGFLITIWAAWYCYHKMNKYRVIVWRKRRMALAAKGISVDPVTGLKRHSSFKEEPLTLARDEEEEIRSPILMEQRQQSYQNNYDMSYRSADNMSVYDADGPQRIPVERDITYSYNPAGMDSTESFPQARPSGQTGSLQRNATTASAFASNLDGPAPEPTHFPVPNPVEPHYQRYGGT